MLWRGFFVLNAICYNRLPRVQTDRLFPLLPLHFLLSPVSRGQRWTAYLARTNHIWLLSVTVNYTPHASCPPAATQWKRSHHTTATRICWRWGREAQSPLASRFSCFYSCIYLIMDLTSLFLLISVGLAVTENGFISFDARYQLANRVRHSCCQ